MFEASDGWSSPHPPPGRAPGRGRGRARRAAPSLPRLRRDRAGAVRARPRAAPARAPPPPAGARPACCRRRAASTSLGLVLGRAAALQAQVRARAHGGRWTRWTPLPHNHAGDRDRTDPVFTGSADEFQLRLRGGARGLKARFVRALPHAPARRARAAARQASAPAIVPRASWGADSVPPRSGPSYGDVQVAFVHHTVTAVDYAPEESARDHPRDRALPPRLQRLERHRLQLPRRPLRRDLRGPRGRHRGRGDRRPGAGLQQPLDRHRLPRHVHQPAARRARDGVAGAADRLEAVAARRAGAGPGHARVRRRREQPLPERDAGRPSSASAATATATQTSCPGEALYAQLPGLRGRAVAASPSPVSAVTVARVQPARRAARRRSPASCASPTAPRPAAPRSASSTWPRARRGRRSRRRRCAADGAWATSVTLPASGQVRAVFAGDGARGRLESAPVTVRVVPSMSLTSDKRRAKAGTSFAVSGTLAPRAAARRVPARAPGRHRAGCQVQRKRINVRGGRFATKVRPDARPGSTASRSSPTA